MSSDLSVSNEKGDRLITDPLKFFIAFFGFGLFGCLRYRENRNKGAAFKSLVELNSAFGGCKDCVVFAHSDVFTWPHLCTALTHDDVSWNDGFATEFFHTKTATG